jgi:hypothetical protein
MQTGICKEEAEAEAQNPADLDSNADQEREAQKRHLSTDYEDAD